MTTDNARSSDNDEGIAVFARSTARMDPARVELATDLLKQHPRIGAVLIDPDRSQIEAVADRVVVVGGSVRPDLLERMPRLEWYQQWGAGADWLLRHSWAREAPFVLTNVAGIHGIQMGEHVFGTLLALVRRLPGAAQAQSEHRWHSPDHEGVGELAGGRMLVLGWGAIGRRVAHLARAFGMTVDVLRRTPSEPPEGVERVGTQEDLDAFLPEADAVVIAVPLTDATRGMFGADAFVRMKGSAYVVNVGRGGIVDEAALSDALRAGRIAGAALDVFDTEPLPEESPLWDAPRLLITGHYAGASPAYDSRALEVFLDNIWKFVAGEPLSRVVDKERGY